MLSGTVSRLRDPAGRKVETKLGMDGTLLLPPVWESSQVRARLVAETRFCRDRAGPFPGSSRRKVGWLVVVLSWGLAQSLWGIRPGNWATMKSSMIRPHIVGSVPLSLLKRLSSSQLSASATCLFSPFIHCPLSD